MGDFKKFRGNRYDFWKFSFLFLKFKYVMLFSFSVIHVVLTLKTSTSLQEVTIPACNILPGRQSLYIR